MALKNGGYHLKKMSMTYIRNGNDVTNVIRTLKENTQTKVDASEDFSEIFFFK